MKFLQICLFGFSLITSTAIFAEPPAGCKCKHCHCIAESHCGCFSKGGCKCTGESSCCPCGDDCECGWDDDCDCNCGEDYTPKYFRSN